MTTATDAYHAQFAAHRTWGEHADRVMRQLVKTGESFTADDFNQLMPTDVKPTTRNAVGGVFQAWKTAGLIEVCGYQCSTNKKRKGGLIRRWRPAAA